jgi:CubicO group peptidase (beta-lactamase class C family)
MKRRAVGAGALPLSAWLLAVGCGDSTGPDRPYVYHQPPEIGDGWETASLEDAGVDLSRLESLVNAARNGTYSALHGVLIAKDGRLVFEEYFPGHRSSGGVNEGAWIEYDRETKHECQSATKSFRSAVLGIAIDQGFLEGVDEPVLSFFPELSDLNTGIKGQITLRHLLTMSSGLDWPETQLPFSHDQNPLRQLYQLPRGQWPRFIFERSMAASPGTVWNYNTGLSLLIKDVLDRATGTSAEDFSDTHLFLRMESRRQYGFPYVDFVLPRDMAKFGQVFLEKGLWKGTRILSEDWVDQSTTGQLTSPWQSPFDGGYGFLWWVKSLDSRSGTVPAFFAHGNGGQSIWVFRSLNLVVVFTGGYFGQMDPVVEWLEGYVLPAFG